MKMSINYISPKGISITLMKVKEPTEHYHVHFVMETEGEQFNVLVTEIHNECKNCASREAIDMALNINSSLSAVALVVDEEGNILEELNLNAMDLHLEKVAEDIEIPADRVLH